MLKAACTATCFRRFSSFRVEAAAMLSGRHSDLQLCSKAICLVARFNISEPLYPSPVCCCYCQGKGDNSGVGHLNITIDKMKYSTVPS